VDMNGHPHAFIGVFEYGGYPYSIYQSSLGHLYDFSYNGTAWSANQISPVSYAAFFHSGGMVNNRPQLSRSDDGSKIIFSWVDSDVPSSMGNAPNMKVVTYDVATGNKSCAIN